MPYERWCMLCGSHKKSVQMRQGFELYLCEDCAALEWHVILMLLMRKREVEVLREVRNGINELGVALDAVLKKVRRSRVHYKQPGCQAHIPEGG